MSNATARKNESITKKQSSKIGKDLQHYLTSQELNGGKDELNKRILDFKDTSIEKGIDTKSKEFKIKLEKINEWKTQ